MLIYDMPKAHKRLSEVGKLLAAACASFTRGPLAAQSLMHRAQKIQKRQTAQGRRPLHWQQASTQAVVASTEGTALQLLQLHTHTLG